VAQTSQKLKTWLLRNKISPKIASQKKNGFSEAPLRCLPYELVQDFFHQRYLPMLDFYSHAVLSAGGQTAWPKNYVGNPKSKMLVTVGEIAITFGVEANHFTPKKV